MFINKGLLNLKNIYIMKNCIVFKKKEWRKSPYTDIEESPRYINGKKENAGLYV